MSDYLYGKNSFTEALRSNRIIKAYVVRIRLLSVN